MREATAVAFRELGFRVIEGGKSGKLAILKTPALTEMFGVRHDNVMRDVEVHIQSHSSDLRSEVEKHCRRARYRTPRGREIDCYELTKVGFIAIAAKYDADLRFLLALAFDALERDDSDSGQTVVAQINARIRELRTGKSGQEELILPLLTHEQPEPDVLPEPTACDLKHVAKANNDNAQARLDFGEGDKVLDDLADEDIPFPRTREPIQVAEGGLRREVWRDDAVEIVLRYGLKAEPFSMHIDDGSVRLPLLPIEGGQLLLCIGPFTPLAVIHRALQRFSWCLPTTIATVNGVLQEALNQPQ